MLGMLGRAYTALGKTHFLHFIRLKYAVHIRSNQYLHIPPCLNHQPTHKRHHHSLCSCFVNLICSIWILCSCNSPRRHNHISWSIHAAIVPYGNYRPSTICTSLQGESVWYASFQILIGIRLCIRWLSGSQHLLFKLTALHPCNVHWIHLAHAIGGDHRTMW